MTYFSNLLSMRAPLIKFPGIVITRQILEKPKWQGTGLENVK
jgi:hypothetical protein